MNIDDQLNKIIYHALALQENNTEYVIIKESIPVEGLYHISEIITNQRKSLIKCLYENNLCPIDIIKTKARLSSNTNNIEIITGVTAYSMI